MTSYQNVASAMREAARRAVDEMICLAKYPPGPVRMALVDARDAIRALPLPADPGGDGKHDVRSGPCPACGFRLKTKVSEPFVIGADPATGEGAELKTKDWWERLARDFAEGFAALRSMHPGGDGVDEAYDRGLSEGMDKGAEFALDNLAEALKLDAYSPADGAETWEGDVAATVIAILRRARVLDEDTGDIATVDQIATLRAETAQAKAEAASCELALREARRGAASGEGVQRFPAPEQNDWREMSESLARAGIFVDRADAALRLAKKALDAALSHVALKTNDTLIAMVGEALAAIDELRELAA